ncbi:MAG TPA: hypothetical protein VGG44_09340 [Tepidisphaeraceae bacterium]|jgi:hypothetical protein
MKLLRILLLSAPLSIGFIGVGCETSHTETDKPGLFGGTTHEETTTTHNPITNTDDKSTTETKTN